MPAGQPSATTIKRIHREMADIKKEDLGDITLAPMENDMHIWRGSIPGPEGSVYEGGVFQIEVVLPPDYPFSAPKAVFKTRIYHMNISDQGGICIDILKHNWSPALSLFKLMLSLSSLLTDPNPRDPLVPSIATEYLRNRKTHDTKARQWTEMYAKPKPIARPGPSQLPPPVHQAQPIAVTNAPGRAGRSRRANAQTPAAPTSQSTSSSRAGPSGIQTAPLPTSSASTPIVIDDSDDEGRNTTSNHRGKRKRAEQSDAAASSSSSRSRRNMVAVLDLLDDADAEDAPVPGPSKKPRTRRGGRPAVDSDDVIVIED